MRLGTLIFLLTLSILCLCPTTTYSQAGYEEGYVIIDGDTLSGWVKDRSPEPFVSLYSQIRFRPHDQKRRKKFSANEIDGYGKGTEHFVSVPLKEESAFFTFNYMLNERYNRIFLKRIDQKGPLTYYEKEFVHDDNSYLDAYPLFYLRGKFEMVRVTQGILGLKKKRLIEYFKPCTVLAEAIEKNELKTTREVFDFFTEHCTD